MGDNQTHESRETRATDVTQETQYEQANEASQGEEAPAPDAESLDSATIIDPDGNTPHNTGIAGPDPVETADSTVQDAPNDAEGCL